MFMKAGVKGQGVGFLFTDNQIVQERFLVRSRARYTCRYFIRQQFMNNFQAAVDLLEVYCIFSLACVNMIKSVCSHTSW